MRKGTDGHRGRDARRARRERRDERREFDEDGIGFIEILVAFLVFMIAFLPILRFLPVGQQVIVNSNHQRDATEIANTLLSNAQSSTIPPPYDPNVQSAPAWTSLASACIQRTDTASYSSSSSTITDASITAGDLGALVQGANISSPAYVGTVTAGSGFVLSASPDSTVAVSPTGAGTTVNLTRQVNCLGTITQNGATFKVYTLGGWCALDSTGTWVTTMPTTGQPGYPSQPSYHVMTKVAWGKFASASADTNVVVDGTELSATSGAPTEGASVAACPLGVQ